MGTTRAVTFSGSFQKVTLGTSGKILGAGNYALSGLTRKTVDVSEFGVDVDIFELASVDAGTITLTNVAYDPTDADQNTLRTAVLNQVKFNPNATSGIRFWINSSSWLAVGTSGYILLTQAGAVEADRNGVARTSFSGIVSGAAMYLTPV